MKQLTNYCPVVNYVDEIAAYPGQLTGFCRANQLDGIELYIYDAEPLKEQCKANTVGFHLKYWPCWMDFWQGNEARLARLFPNRASRKKYFGGAEAREAWLEVIRDNIKTALSYEPEYLVWHVADCDNESIYTWNFAYSSEQVLQGTIEVFQELTDCIPKNVKLLLENLWWPGLRLTNPLATGRFFDALYRLGYENIGIMLDTGHLMNTNPALTSEAEGVQYVIDVGKRLGSLKQLVKGFHLSCSLSGAYQRETVTKARNACTWIFPKDSMTLMQHITTLDQHRAFRTAKLTELVAFYEPQYINHELYYDNMQQLAEYLKLQRL